MSVSVATGKLPAICESSKGLNYLYWVDGSDIKGLIQSRGGTVLKSAFVAVANVDSGTGVAVDESYKQARVWRMGMLYSKGGVLTYATSTDGITFN